MILENTLAAAQLHTLPDLYASYFDLIDHRIRTLIGSETLNKVSRLYVLGDGDSYHAAAASRFAFMSRTSLEYHAVPAMKFLGYEIDQLRDDGPGTTMVVGISASGESRRVIQSLERVREKTPQAVVMAMTGSLKSTLAEITDIVGDVSIPDMGRTPGIRTYTAALFGLTALCLRFGELQGCFSTGETDAARAALTMLSDDVGKTVEDAAVSAEMCAEWPHVPFVTVVGSGPHIGTAMFSAAKLVEIAGIHASAQDIEGWMHVERFAYPTCTPLIMIAPGGRSFSHALKTCRAARRLGHRIVVLTDQTEDNELLDTADILCPVTGKVEECFQHLLYYIPSPAIAAVLGSGIGRGMFMSDNQELQRKRTELTRNLKETV